MRIPPILSREFIILACAVALICTALMNVALSVFGVSFWMLATANSLTTGLIIAIAVLIGTKLTVLSSLQTYLGGR